ncbi:MAG: hypothetical protein E7280_05275 [Lachnospiraceae bacterium]|jgi:hypothetical protein|nr:hypothetical protein [Lachnospiraceae bacterium]
MNEELKFLEHMNRIARIGKENGGKITRGEIEKELSFSLNEAQWEVMGEFLFSRQVRLEGYEPTNAVEKPEYVFDQDELNFMRYYEADIRDIPRISDEKMEELLKKVVRGQMEASEAYQAILPKIYEEAKSYADGREPLGDLVQEANLSIFTWLTGIQSETGLMEDFRKEISLAIGGLLAEGEDRDQESHKLVDKLNQLVEAVEALKAQNAAYTIEDISEFLDISIPEIERLLKIAGE